MKECFKCGEIKPLNEFYKHKRMADGHLNKCKNCAKRDVRQHRKVSDRPREYDMERYRNQPERRKFTTKISREWRKKHPEKYKAQTAVGNAIRDGRLTKQTCEVCGDEEVHAHHDNYSKPLEVRWLCPRHHMIYHHSHE